MKEKGVKTVSNTNDRTAVFWILQCEIIIVIGEISFCSIVGEKALGVGL